MKKYFVSRFYTFHPLQDLEQIRDRLVYTGRLTDTKGSILLAPEGINGTICGSQDALAEVQQQIQSHMGLEHIAFHTHPSDFVPFFRFKVLLKREIVSMGYAPAAISAHPPTYVEPKDWNALLQRDDVYVLDTRNNYETRIGRFTGANLLNIEHFRDFPQLIGRVLPASRQTPIAMYCTGGIRCEKASLALNNLGFNHVLQLKGGILSYFEQTDPKDSLWQGECFVFDQRVSLTPQLQPGQFRLCYACRQPLSNDELTAERYEYGVSCPHCHNRFTPVERERFRERIRQIQLANQRLRHHLGPAQRLLELPGASPASRFTPPY